MTVVDTACTAKRGVIAVRDTPLTGRAGWGREWCVDVPGFYVKGDCSHEKVN